MNQKIENRLNQRDIKPTAMRILVLQYLMEQDKAISLQTIESAFDIADKSTLYRTLKHLKKTNWFTQ